VGILTGRVAVVAGASRGVGRGVATGLGEAGATVYVTGRTVAGDEADVPGTIDQTAAEVSELGGRGVAVRCDHRDDSEVEALFRKVGSDEGRLDVLVNSVWAGYESLFADGEYIGDLPFWRQPLSRWGDMIDAGVRAAYVASSFAAPLMIRAEDGLIVHVSYWAARKHIGTTVYGVAKAATDKMAADMGHELREHGVAVVSLYPGLVRTERVMAAAEFFDLGNSESPRFAGRVVAALAADPDRMRRSGDVLVAAELAREYGVLDVDGSSPRPLSLADA
jgi:NAD(P)-dependent dehydrogenase (short-subunit alcohol dehydrogenase family)